MRLSPTQREIAKLRLQVANLQNALLRRDETILDLRRELGALKRKELYRLAQTDRELNAAVRRYSHAGLTENELHL